MSDNAAAANAAIPLERDVFLRQLLRHLTGALQDTVGLEEAEGFISVVGQQIGDEINQSYRQALQLPALNATQVADVLTDLKKRIQGDFYIAEQSEDKIVLRNNRCPFGDKVIGREALCMMTTNVFGVITAENLGYARVSIDKSIARGHRGCEVTVHLNANSSQDVGFEFFRAD